MTRERLPSGLPVKPGHATIGIEHPEYGIISIDEPLAELVSRLWTLRIETRSSCQGCPCGGDKHLLCESKSADLASIDFDWEDGTRFLGYTEQVRTDRWRVTNWKEGDARRGVYFPLEDIPRILEVLQAVDVGEEFEPYLVRVKVHAHDPDLCLLAAGNVLTLESVVFATSERDATAMIDGIGVASAEVEFALPL